MTGSKIAHLLAPICRTLLTLLAELQPGKVLVDKMILNPMADSQETLDESKTEFVPKPKELAKGTGPCIGWCPRDVLVGVQVYAVDTKVDGKP